MSNTSGLAVLQLIADAGPVAKAVLLILTLFSVVCWALIVEKGWQFGRVRRQTEKFFRAFREGRRHSVVYSAAKKFRESPLAQLYMAGYQEVSGIPEVADHLLEDAEDGVAGERLEATVWGIIAAFHGIGQQGSASLAVVAPGISEALIATAAGLGAAIPAVMGYNYFVSRVKHWATEMDGFTLDLLNLFSRPMPKTARSAKEGV